MKRLPLFALLLALFCLCASASAEGPSGALPIARVIDSTGADVTSLLTDGAVTTVWTRGANPSAPDLTLTLYSASVGEIWVRSGHCYSQNYYNHYDRPDVVAVTLVYSSGRYATDSVTYRYRLNDSFRRNDVSDNWNAGYQRLLLPKRIDGVTRIELTVESVREGYGRTGATLSDIAVTRGGHATAVPNSATATPRPYVSYVTATPNPYVEYLTPEPEIDIVTPTRDVIYLTPEPTEPPVEVITPRPTKTPLVEYLTPTPTRAPVEYPSSGIPATLLKRIATRIGPSNKYEEPGSFFGAGDEVNVISKAWGDDSDIWWYLVEFQYGGEWIRAYTPANRIDLDPNYVPTESDPTDAREVLVDHRVYYGPGTEYKMYKKSMLYQGSRAVIVAIDGGWAHIEYHDYAVDLTRRGWVPVDVLSDYPFEW